jgi:hypothetical protein
MKSVVRMRRDEGRDNCCFSPSKIEQNCHKTNGRQKKQQRTGNRVANSVSPNRSKEGSLRKAFRGGVIAIFQVESMIVGNNSLFRAFVK